MSEPRYLTRVDLRLRDHRRLSPLAVPVSTLFVHHTVTAGRDGPDEWRSVQRFHMDSRRYADIAYHAGIGPLAEVMEGRPPAMDGGATLGWNQRSLAVCFVGDFSTVPPSTAQLRSAAWVAHLWMLMGLLHPAFVLLGHRDAGSSACPGDALYAHLPTLRAFIDTPAPAPLPEPPTPPEEDDMPHLMLRDTRDGTIWAVYAGGSAVHLGPAAFKFYEAALVPLKDCAVEAGAANPHAEADRLRAQAG